MAQKTAIVMPNTIEILIQMGEQIKNARVRRGISAELVAERASVSRATVWAIEKGSPSVSMGAYAAVLHAINGMDCDLLLVAKDELLEKTLREVGGAIKCRAPRRKVKIMANMEK